MLLATAPAPCDAAFTPQQSVAQWIVSKKVAVKTIASYSPGGIEKEVIVEKKIVEPTTEQVAIDKPFVNDGPFSWMSQYLNKFGILQEGKMLQMDRFPFVVDIDESSKPSAEESSNLRREAAENLMNIGMDERKRRDNAGTFMLGAAATYAFWAAAIADDGGIMGHLIRFAVVGPLALGWGYKLSAQKGL